MDLLLHVNYLHRVLAQPHYGYFATYQIAIVQSLRGVLNPGIIEVEAPAVECLTCSS